jgi:hypothetical protein
MANAARGRGVGASGPPRAERVVGAEVGGNRWERGITIGGAWAPANQGPPPARPSVRGARLKAPA